MRLPEKLKSGDDFKWGVYEKINALIDYCRSRELKGDNRTIRLNQTPSGITLSALPQNRQSLSGGTPAYAGPFCVEVRNEISEDGFASTYMKCWNSLMPNISYPAGYIKNGNNRISVPAVEMQIAVFDAVVYAAAVYVPENDSLSGQILISYDDTEPTPGENERYWCYTIARIVNGKVTQVHQGTDISITGVWTSDLL